MYRTLLALASLSLVCYSRPLTDSRQKRSSNELSNQEEDLKRLADKSSKSSVSIAHHSSEVQRINVENGKTHVAQDLKDAVFDPMSGELLRRLEQRMRGEKSGAEQPLLEQVHTELDVPSQNVHKSWDEQKMAPTEKTKNPEYTEEPEEKEEPASIQREPETADQSTGSKSQNDQSATSANEPDEDIETDEEEKRENLQEQWLQQYSPVQVAQYLVISGDVNGFLNAVQGLVETHKLTTEEADRYENQVSKAYQQLVRQQMMQQFGESEPEEYKIPEEDVEKTDATDIDESKLEEPEVEEPEVEKPEAEEQDAEESQDSLNLAYAQMLKTTLKRLYTEAYAEGNLESEKTLKEFVRYVTQMADAGALPEEEVSGVVSILTSLIESNGAAVSEATHQQADSEASAKESEEKEA